jgi:hypothetical protein
MQGIPVASSPPSRVSLRRLVFWLPLAGYSLLAILMALFPKSPAVLAFLGAPLVLLAFAVKIAAAEGRSDASELSGIGVISTTLVAQPKHGR